MGAYDWSRDYKVGQRYELRNGSLITVLRIHDNGSMSAALPGCYDITGNPEIHQWDSQGWYYDYWSPSDKDISGKALDER
jgi:hypothetical protein